MTMIEMMLAQREVLFCLAPAHVLVSANEPGAPPAPRLFLGRTGDGNVWGLRHDLPTALRARLASILRAEPPATDFATPAACLPALRQLLAAHTPIASEWRGPAWVFDAPMRCPENVVVLGPGDEHRIPAAFGDAAALLAQRQPCAALLHDGVAAALCFSARSSHRAAEAGVETLPEHRRRGYASAVIAGWAAAVQAHGHTALYSTSWDNMASRGVARRLGLRLYGEDVALG